jgi:hypothetical protein
VQVTVPVSGSWNSGLEEKKCTHVENRRQMFRVGHGMAWQCRHSQGEQRYIITLNQFFLSKKMFRGTLSLTQEHFFLNFYFSH